MYTRVIELTTQPEKARELWAAFRRTLSMCAWYCFLFVFASSKQLPRTVTNSSL